MGGMGDGDEWWEVVVCVCDGGRCAMEVVGGECAMEVVCVCDGYGWR